MLKKLFVTAAAAAAVSVPLAGVAWATPSDNNPPGQGATGPGVPHEIGGYLDRSARNANPNPVPPGKLFNMAKEGFGGPGVSTPAAIGDFVNFVLQLCWCPDHIWPYRSRVSHEDFHTWVHSRA